MGNQKMILHVISDLTIRIKKNNLQTAIQNKTKVN